MREENEIIGFWGLVTSTQDWCEDNYVISYYIAEFWNTLSNLFILFFGLFGLVRCIQYNTEKRFLWSYFFLAVVGVGSAVFHCTLQWKAQLLDEIPMIFTSMPLVYSIFAADCESSLKLKLYQLFCIAYPMVVIPIYLYIHDFGFFFCAYGFSVVLITLKLPSTVKLATSVTPKEQLVFPNHPKKMFMKAFFTYFGALLIWTIDNAFCSQLQQVKQFVGPNFSPFFELHAWWHFGSGYGTYITIIASQTIHTLIQQSKKDQPKRQYTPKTAYFFENSFPYIEYSETTQQRKNN